MTLTNPRGSPYSAIDYLDDLAALGVTVHAQGATLFHKTADLDDFELYGEVRQRAREAGLTPARVRAAIEERAI